MTSKLPRTEKVQKMVDFPRKIQPGEQQCLFSLKEAFLDTNNWILLIGYFYVYASRILMPYDSLKDSILKFHTNDFIFPLTHSFERLDGLNGIL